MRSKKEPFSEVAPGLLKVRIENQPFYSITPWGETPRNNDRLSSSDKTYLMTGAIWKHPLAPRDDVDKAKFLLTLLQKSSNQGEKILLIYAINYDQWCADTESVLLSFDKNMKEDFGIRSLSASTLLNRCDINTHMPLAIEILLVHNKCKQRGQAFNFLTNEGNRLFTLSEENRRKVIATGFDILTQLSDEDLKRGYFVARRLGYILKTPESFAPVKAGLKTAGSKIYLFRVK